MFLSRRVLPPEHATVIFPEAPYQLSRRCGRLRSLRKSRCFFQRAIVNLMVDMNRGIHILHNLIFPTMVNVGQP